VDTAVLAHAREACALDQRTYSNLHLFVKKRFEMTTMIRAHNETIYYEFGVGGPQGEPNEVRCFMQNFNKSIQEYFISTFDLITKPLMIMSCSREKGRRSQGAVH